MSRFTFHFLSFWVFPSLFLGTSVFLRPGPVFPLCFLIFASWSFVLCWFVVCSVFCSWINLVLLSDNRTGLSYLWKRTEKGHCPVCVSTELKSFGSVFVVFCVFVYTVCRFILSPTDRMGTCRFLWNTSPDKFSEEQEIKTEILRAACIKGMCLWTRRGEKKELTLSKNFPFLWPDRCTQSISALKMWADKALWGFGDFWNDLKRRGFILSKSDI